MHVPPDGFFWLYIVIKMAATDYDVIKMSATDYDVVIHDIFVFPN